MNFLTNGKFAKLLEKVVRCDEHSKLGSSFGPYNNFQALVILDWYRNSFSGPLKDPEDIVFWTASNTDAFVVLGSQEVCDMVSDSSLMSFRTDNLKNLSKEDLDTVKGIVSVLENRVKVRGERK